MPTTAGIHAFPAKSKAWVARLRASWRRKPVAEWVNVNAAAL
jgi:hypothetical protein